MASSGNFATLNPLNTRGSSASSQITNGNLQYNGQATQDEVGCTINVGNDGVPKVYFEVYIINNHDTGWLGIYDTKVLTLKYEKAYGTTSYRAMKFSTGQKVTGSTSSNYIGDGSENNSRSGQTVGVAIDVPNGKIWFAINNAWGSDGGGSPTDSNVAFTDLTTTGSYDIVTHMGGASVAQPDWLFNFGADSTMQGRVSAGGNSANSVGDFRYSVPSGFEALSSKNINLSDDIDPAQTDDDYPSKQFGVVTWTGDGTTSRSISVGFQPDFIWFKSRSSAFSHRLYDTSRGINSNGGKRLFSNTTGAEVDQTSGQDISAVGTDGFTTGASSNLYTNDTNSGGLQVAYCWRANGGVTSSNTDGSITSTVQANTKAGFSIITYTGTGSNATIGHSLSAKPDFFIVKSRSGGTGRNWAVYHSSQGATKYAELDNNGQFYTSSLRWNDTEPTNSLISLGTTGSVNASSENFVCYAWHNVEGFQKFGSYVGNGNDDGSYIHLGFRARYFFLKEASANDDWVAYDTARSTFNPTQKVLRYDTNAAEFDGSGRAVDVLSNGLKIRTSNGTINTSGNTYIFGGLGDVPFKYNNTF